MISERFLEKMWGSCLPNIKEHGVNQHMTVCKTDVATQLKAVCKCDLQFMY